MNGEMNTLRGNNLINEFLALIIQILFFAFFTGVGIISVFGSSPDGFPIGIIFLGAATLTLFKIISTIKNIKDQITDIKTESRIIVTIGNIGHFIYCLILVTVVILFIILFMDKIDSTNEMTFIIIIGSETCLGLLLTYIDKTLVNHHKNNKIIDINLNK